MVEFCLTLFLSFPGCSHPGLVGFLPLSGVTAPVASGSSELEAALPVHSVRSLRRSLALVRADDSLHLVSSLSAEHWLMALRSRHCRITAGLASMDFPLLVSSVESQLWGFCSWLYRPSWLAQGCIPLLRLLPYF